MGPDAPRNQVPPSQKADFVPIDPKVLGSIILERQQIQAAAQARKNLSEEEKKKLALSEFVLGSAGEEPVLTTQEFSLEEAKDIPAVGEFTFGDIKTLLTAQGHSRGDVLRFLKDVESGSFNIEEAIQFLKDCQEWEQIKNDTDQTRAEFLAQKYAAHEQARKARGGQN
jgi:hypothetical protein